MRDHIEPPASPPRGGAPDALPPVPLPPVPGAVPGVLSGVMPGTVPGPGPEAGPAPGAAPAAGQGLRLAAVVVSHNRLGQLRRTVRRLLKEGVDHLVVVDNASTDGTRDWLAGLSDPRLHVVLSQRNTGGAGGFERGLRTARALHDADWYLVMDDDARPRPGTLARFRELAAPVPPAPTPSPPGAPAWEALAGGVFYPDGRICETNRPARNPFWCRRSFWRTLLGGGRSGFHVVDADYGAQAPVAVDAASFVGLFLSRAAIDRVGYPQGSLFIYGDDVLYTLGLSEAGGRIGFAPWLEFEHDCTTFRRGEGQIHRPLWKVYYNYRNGLFAYRKAAGPVLFWPVLLVSLPKWLLKLRGYGPGERPVVLRLLALAVRDGLAGRHDRPHRQIRARARLSGAGQGRGGSRADTPLHPAPRDAPPPGPGQEAAPGKGGGAPPSRAHVPASEDAREGARVTALAAALTPAAAPPPGSGPPATAPCAPR